jgi:hypothetical protein
MGKALKGDKRILRSKGTHKKSPPPINSAAVGGLLSSHGGKMLPFILLDFRSIKFSFTESLFVILGGGLCVGFGLCVDAVSVSSNPFNPTELAELVEGIEGIEGNEPVALELAAAAAAEAELDAVPVDAPNSSAEFTADEEPELPEVTEAASDPPTKAAEAADNFHPSAFLSTALHFRSKCCFSMADEAETRAFMYSSAAVIAVVRASL